MVSEMGRGAPVGECELAKNGASHLRAGANLDSPLPSIGRGFPRHGRHGELLLRIGAHLGSANLASPAPPLPIPRFGKTLSGSSADDLESEGKAPLNGGSQHTPFL